VAQEWKYFDNIFVTSGTGAKAPGFTAAIRLIAHPVFLKLPLSPPDVSTSHATREIQVASLGTLMGEKE
jgi:hypothetical protein